MELRSWHDATNLTPLLCQIVDSWVWLLACAASENYLLGGFEGFVLGTRTVVALFKRFGMGASCCPCAGVFRGQHFWFHGRMFVPVFLSGWMPTYTSWFEQSCKHSRMGSKAHELGFGFCTRVMAFGLTDASRCPSIQKLWADGYNAVGSCDYIASLSGCLFWDPLGYIYRQC